MLLERQSKCQNEIQIRILFSNSITCCIPLFSGVVSVLADKMLVFGMLNDDIRNEITFDSSTNADLLFVYIYIF